MTPPKPKMDLGDMAKRHSLPVGASTLFSLSALAGVIWYDLEPRSRAAAKEEVHNILVAGDYAKRSDVKKLNENVEKAEDRIRVLERKQDTNNAKAEAERGAIKDKIDDTNQLLRDLVRDRDAYRFRRRDSQP